MYPDLDFVAKSQSLEAVAESVKIKAFTVVGVHDFKLSHLAYSTEGKNHGALELHRVTAREVRALAASTSAFRGMATESITQSCTWRSRSTFSDFYLRDMCAFLDDIFVMSSSVAGNASVSSIPVTSHQ